MQQFHRGAQVDGDLAVEILAGDGAKILRQLDGGVPGQDVERRPGGDGGRQVGAGAVVDKILGEGGGLPAHGPDGLDDGGGITVFLWRVGVVDGQAAPRAGETQGDRTTDLATGAGDQGGAASQAERGEGIGHAGTPGR